MGNEFDPTTLARREDPQTSHDAASSMDGKLEHQHQQILTVLKQNQQPLTAEQIGTLIGYSVWRRMSELERKKQITKSGLQHKNKSGRMANQYVLL